MKDRWCGNFDRGVCTLATESGKPELAERQETVVKSKRTEVIKDPLRIASLMSFQNTGSWEGIVMPKQVTVDWNENNTQVSFLCRGRGCKSKQRGCDSYK